MESIEIHLTTGVLNKEDGLRLSKACLPVYQLMKKVIPTEET